MYPRDDERNLFVHLNHGVPIRLRWGGWHTDTHSLGKERWRFSAHEERDDYRNCWKVYLGATSPDGQICIAGTRLLERGDLLGTYSHSGADDFCHRGFDMDHYTIKDVYKTVPEISMLRAFDKMVPVDPHYAIAEPIHKIYRMQDFRVFKPIADIGKEIYIPPDSVDDLLNKILKIQYKEQQVKKKLILPETKPIIQAQIISL